MILADKLIDLRKKNGWSQEDLADKLEVSRQSISKWESAQSVPDMNRILKLSALFGVSTDYLLKDELGPEAMGGELVPTPVTEPPLRQVVLAEATDFLAYRELAAKRIALGVMLCILSPILLILLCGISGELPTLHQMDFAPPGALGFLPLLFLLVGAAVLILTALPLGKDSRRFSPCRMAAGILLAICLVMVLSVWKLHALHVSETQAAGLGLVALFLLVGAAVALFVTTGLWGSRFAYLTKLPFETAYGVDGMVKDRREKYRKTFGLHLTLGIVLCVLSVLPLFLVLIFYGEDNGPAGAIPHVCAVGLLLGLVAVGVLLIVHSSILWVSYQILLEEGDYSRKNKTGDQGGDTLSTVYWCSVTAVYLAWSFLGHAWGISWAIWPVAAVLFGAVLAIRKLRMKKQPEGREVS